MKPLTEGEIRKGAGTLNAGDFVTGERESDAAIRPKAMGRKKALVRIRPYPPTEKQDQSKTPATYAQDI